MFFYYYTSPIDQSRSFLYKNTDFIDYLVFLSTTHFERENKYNVYPYTVNIPNNCQLISSPKCISR